MAAPISFCIPLIASLFVVASVSNLDHHEATPFSYSGTTGPNKWGSLCPSFSVCSTGKKQSPVNIVKDQTVLNKNLKPLTRDYSYASATLINNGFHIGMHYDEDVGVLIVDGKNYTLKQMHWHSPSEHQIDGVQYAVELHLLHQATDGTMSVVAILYQYGDADPLLSKIQDSLVNLPNNIGAGQDKAHIPVGKVDTKHMRRETRKYYRYIGSLTTPPCTENIIWNVLGKVRNISKEQVDALKAPLHSDSKDNSRPVQPLNGRQVERYE